MLRLAAARLTLVSSVEDGGMSLMHARPGTTSSSEAALGSAWEKDGFQRRSSLIPEGAPTTTRRCLDLHLSAPQTRALDGLRLRCLGGEV